MKKRVLIIDDDPDFLDVLGSILEKSGVEVQTCAYGEEGLDLIRQTVPDLVVLDVFMPGIHGLQALRQLRHDPQTARVPVIVVSSMPWSELEPVSAELDADFVDKGATTQVVAARVKKKLGLG
ncbi:MAG: response regulator [Elusimicrobiota bacterium]